MNQTTHNTIPYAAPLQAARDNFAAGEIERAEKACVEAIGLMAAAMSANNPKLADAYGLHVDTCMELSVYAHSEDESKSWLARATASQRHKLAVLDAGMTDAGVMTARLQLGNLLAIGDNHVEAAAELEVARTVVAELLDRNEADVSVIHYLEASYMLAEALVEVSRASEAATVLASSFNRLRPEHYRDFEVMKAVTQVSALLTAVLGEEASEEGSN